MKKIFAILLVLLTARAWGYSEDQLQGDPHSTFHYNLVRTLAAAAGFSDQSHFCRVFKRLVGVSPALYRATFRP